MTNPNDISAESSLIAQHEGSAYSYSIDDAGSACILRCITHEQHVRVPDALDGHPVSAIAHAAFAALDATESLELPAGIEQIGWNAFAGCRKLRRIAFPPTLDHTDKTWLLDCSRITDIVLPAAAETIAADFLKSCHPQRIVIGKGTRTLDAPPYWSACLHEVAVDAESPYLSTDGRLLYTRDGITLLKCLVEEEECRVQPNCRIVDEKAFAFNTKLARIHLPDSVEQIGEAAFFGSGLATFTAPPHLRRIGSRAFGRCTRLRSVDLDCELEEIGEEPFRQCETLERLAIPASVRAIGLAPIAETPLTATGPAPTFTIDPANPALFVEDGLLYRRRGPDLALVCALDPEAAACTVRANTTSIEAEAFAGHKALARISLPEGLTEIGANAFCDCERLAAIELPSTVRSIGTRALFNTALTSLRIPAALAHLGSCALAVESTDGRVPSRREPRLRDVRIDPGNRRFFLESGMLCEHVADYARVVLYVGPQTDVRIPATVTEIGPYAFAGVRGLARLALHSGIERIGTLGLSLLEPPEVLEIDMAGGHKTRGCPLSYGAKAGGGDSSYGGSSYVLKIRPIRGKHGLRAMRNAFANGHIDVALLTHDMDRMAPYVRDPLERLRYMVERLCDPCLLSDTMRANYGLVIARSLPSLCVAAAAGGWHHGYDMLADLGFLNAETIVSAIDAVVATGNVAATAYLINLKEKRWGAHPDYSL